MSRNGNGRVVDLRQTRTPVGTAIELFAGVGGFRLGLRDAGWQVVWSNQWEPSTKRQHASDCYIARFGDDGHVCADIARVMDDVEAGRNQLPEHDLLVGGFPCQDYSVARTLNQAAGIEGRKGVLWWEIHRLLQRCRPKYFFLENVDRLLKSPANQRGRDFAIMLGCLSDLNYFVEWRVVNAADYGFPQKRRRVLIVGRSLGQEGSTPRDPLAWLLDDGVFARALPVEDPPVVSMFPWHAGSEPDIRLDGSLVSLTESFGRGRRVTQFERAGVMWDRQIWTRHVVPKPEGGESLGDILLPVEEVPEAFFIPEEQLPAWRYLKGAKREERRHRASGVVYHYAEGAIAFPDPTDQPSRTILTGEGGSGPSRFKHVIRAPSGRYRRLTPLELERLNGFPDGWTDTGMSDSRRAFMMGNALVVGLVKRVAIELADRVRAPIAGSPSLSQVAD